MMQVQNYLRYPRWPLIAFVRSGFWHMLPYWLLTLGILMSPSIMAAVLKDVEFATLPGNQVRIDLVLSTPIGAPQDFSIDSPARIVLDLRGVTSELPRKNVAIDVGPVKSLTALDTEGRTRVVINLTNPVPYRIQSLGDRVTIAINEAPAGPSIAASPPDLNKVPVAGQGPVLRDITFHRGSAGEGQVRIKLPRSDTRALVSKKGGKVIIEVLDAFLPEHLRRRMDVVDFGTPVQAIESLPAGRDIAITVNAVGEYEYLAYQIDDLFTLDFRPLGAGEKELKRKENSIFSGERLSLNFQDIEVRAVLQLLADFTNMNFVASDSVKGNITLRLKNVPWDQALDIILKSKQLTMRQKGNVIMVGLAAEVLQQEEEELAANERMRELAALRTEVFQLNYANAAEIARVLDPVEFQTTDTGAGISNLATEIGGNVQARRDTSIRGGGKEFSESSKGVGQGNILGNESGNWNKQTIKQFQQGSAKRMLSSRGSVTTDLRTNSIMVQDTPEKLEEVRQILAKLDVPVRQVMIESRVVIASENFSRDLGVRFGYSRWAFNENTGAFNQISGSRGNVDAGRGNVYRNNILSPLYPGQGSGEGELPSDNLIPLMVDLPVTDPSGTLGFLIGKTGSYLLQLELSAMQKEGRGEIISSPKVITSDNSPAIIEVGQEIPYQTASQQGTNTEFKPAKLNLIVLPKITPDDHILIDLIVTKDNADYTTPTDAGYPINTRSIQTSVLVDNGETVVLGGVHERNRSSATEQVPWLGDLPILGHLFRNNSKIEKNEELLIFVTPRILKKEIHSKQKDF